ncbi:MAG TPA: hypothetical protein VHW01_24470, partial [Polyangiaceae bacterium]|nr:hypothetical protein [Polyangiaceae bacterium]
MLEGSGTRKLGGRDPLRAFQRFFAWSIVLLFVSFFPSRAYAYAWMIKHAYSGCPVCHADPSGGELLTAYGRAQSDLLLRMRYGKPGGSSEAQPSSSGSSSFDSFDSDEDDKKGSASPAAAPDKAAPADDDKTDANSGEDDDDDDADKPAAAKPGAAKSDGAAKPAAKADAEAAPAAEAPKEELKTDDSGSIDTSGFLWGLVNTPDWLLLGGSYRQLSVYKLSPKPTSFVTFPMMADVYGQMQFGQFRVEGSLGIVRVGVGSPYARSAQITGNQGDQWNLLSRTHWIGYDLADGQVTLRAGHLNLPFGVRIPEHTMWVRQSTRTDRESAQQDGVALAYNGEKLRGEAMGIAGNYQVRPDKFRERGYSLYLEYMTGTRTAIGLSSLVT